IFYQPPPPRRRQVEQPTEMGRALLKLLSLTLTRQSTAAAAECARTPAAPSATVHSSSSAASARSAVAPAGPDAATASMAADAAPASTAARRLCSGRSSARSTLAAGRAEAGSRRAVTTPAITGGGQGIGVGEESGARDLSNRRRAGRLAPEANCSSAARNASARLKEVAWEGSKACGPRSGSGVGCCWWWCCRGNLHWVKLWEVDDEEEEEEEVEG
ncbi:hypothetical protein GW17_00062372, partial [Ensete ventricosum]